MALRASLKKKKSAWGTISAKRWGPGISKWDTTFYYAWPGNKNIRQFLPTRLLEIYRVGHGVHISWHSQIKENGTEREDMRERGFEFNVVCTRRRVFEGHVSSSTVVQQSSQITPTRRFQDQAPGPRGGLGEGWALMGQFWECENTPS
jgi:hypothetical protein